MSIFLIRFPNNIQTKIITKLDIKRNIALEIDVEAKKNGFDLTIQKTKNSWAALGFKKKD